MPLYRYRNCEGECYLCNGELNIRQKFDDPPLTTCPYCRHDIERIFGLPRPHIVSRKDILSDSNVASHGFAKYQNAGGGRFEKVAGGDEAPDTLNRGNIERGVAAFEDPSE